MPLFSPSESGIPSTVQARSTLPPAEALTLIAPIDLPSVFHRWGPFPAVVSVEGQTGTWDAPGRSRRPHFSDGGSARETMTEYTPGAGFAYELRDFTDVFGRLVDGIRGEWTFTPDGDGCIVRWTWEFKPKRGMRLPLAGVVVPLFRRYMQRVMDASVALAEREALAAR